MLDLLFRVAVLLQYFQEDWIAEFSPFPQQIRDQNWAYFFELQRILKIRRSWWQAQRIVTTLFQVLPLQEGKFLLEEFLSPGEGLTKVFDIRWESVKIAVCSTVQSFLQTYHGRYLIDDWQWNSQLSSAIVLMDFSDPENELRRLVMSFDKVLWRSMYASLDGNDQYMEASSRLFRGDGNFNAIDSFGQTELHSLISSLGPIDQIESLIKRRARTDIRNWFCDTPLQVAARCNYEAAAASLLIHGGADPNSSNGKSARTALHIAAELGRVQVMQILIKEGADPSKADFFDITPLMLAASGGHLEFLKTFPMTEVDTEARTVDGRMALTEAARGSGTQEVTDYVRMYCRDHTYTLVMQIDPQR